MKKGVFILVLVLIALFLSISYVLLSRGKQAVSLVPSRVSEKLVVAHPWVEVFSSTVFELKPDGSIARELRTGDELLSTTTIRTDKGGMVNIYFPDGSVARFEPNTTFVLREASYDPQSEKLLVRIELTAGRVWSKIIDLTTPDSIWEVRTSNAIATVRGTAFGFGYFEGRSRIFGSEHNVSVGVLDPKTKIVIEGTERMVSPNKLFEIKQEDVEKIKNNPRLAAVADIPESLAREDFFKRNQDADSAIDKKIEELDTAGLSKEEAKRVFREDVIEQFREEIEQQRNDEKNNRAIDVPVESKRNEGSKIMSTENRVLKKSEDNAKAPSPKTEDQDARNELRSADTANQAEAGGDFIQNSKNQIDALTKDKKGTEAIDAVNAKAANQASENQKIEGQPEAVPNLGQASVKDVPEDRKNQINTIDKKEDVLSSKAVGKPIVPK